MQRNHYWKYTVLILIFSVIISLSIICEPNCGEIFKNNSEQGLTIKLSAIKNVKKIENLKKLLDENYEINSISSCINTIVQEEQTNKKEFIEKKLFPELTDSIYLYLDSESNFDTFFKYAYNSLKLKYVRIDIITNQAEFNNALKDSWYSYLSSRLRSINYDKLSICQRDKYLYLKLELELNGYYSNQKQSNFDKIIYNIKKSDWSHLISSIYYKSSLIEKILISILFTFTIFLYLNYLIIFLQKLFKK
jgi:hypothetical protein